MKKLAIVLCVVLIAAMVLPLSVSAATWYIKENAPITVSKVAPTIDGTISADEGWSNKAIIDESTLGYFGLPNQLLTGSGEMYFAYSDEGLYFGMTYTELGSAYCVKFYYVDGDTDGEPGNAKYMAVYADENAPSYEAEPGKFPTTTPDGYALDYYRIDDYTTSAGHGTHPLCVYWTTSYVWYSGAINNIQTSDAVDEFLNPGDAGWNGDVFTLALDPLGQFLSEGFLMEKAPRYAVGLFADNTARVYLTESTADKDLSDVCKGSCKINGNKMCFEVMIPWDEIVEDYNTFAGVAGLSHTFTKDELIADGATHTAQVAYYDRYYSEEIADVDNWGIYAIVPTTTVDGYPGNSTSGFNIKCHGLTLNMSDPSNSGNDTTGATDETSGSSDSNATTTAAGGNNSSNNKNSATTTKAAGTGGKSGGNNSSAQTFDAGIAVAIGALAASGIGIVYSRKRK